MDYLASLYADTKKARELMAHAYAKLYGIPCTGLRYFTVYGPIGRSDMVYFKSPTRFTPAAPSSFTTWAAAGTTAPTSTTSRRASFRRATTSTHIRGSSPWCRATWWMPSRAAPSSRATSATGLSPGSRMVSARSSGDIVSITGCGTTARGAA